MSERSFAKEIEQLRLGPGETFVGEGILAVTKALLQSGVSYVGGYPGAPISHLLDVMVQAKELMGELGVHVEANTNEASAAAMLGASIAYPVRGAVTWKSVVGTNVAADALSNLASPGVIGGAMIVVGEDYGEGASVIQERTLAFALKSSIWMLDPRPNLTSMVDMVEQGFELSEASNSPVMLTLRIRACHLQGQFVARANRRGKVNAIDKTDPAEFDYDRLSHPPATFVQEAKKVAERRPAAEKFIVDRRLNERFDGPIDTVGIIMQGGLYNTLLRRLAALGLADNFGKSQIPLLVLNVTHPLVPGEITDFCAGKMAVLVVEEGNPEYIEQQIGAILRKADIQTRVMGKDLLPAAGEYTAEIVTAGLVDFVGETEPVGVAVEAVRDRAARLLAARQAAASALGDDPDNGPPPRPPGFCTGCPERPVFSAIKLLREELGDIHISTDIGCHSLATFEPFSMGNSILGYGMSLASAAAVASFQKQRPIAIMGDGGFWHNGLQTGVLSQVFNHGDAVLIIMQNGYASATGQQYLPPSATADGIGQHGTQPGEIEGALRALHVKWIRTVSSYGVTTVLATLREAMTTSEPGLKVIIADGECMLARQRRVRSDERAKLERRERVVTPRFGIDADICTGDHACIRLSGCPSLTVADNPDPFRDSPVATIDATCVGCGLCGENAHVATLCPSFYGIERVRNPRFSERLADRLRRRVIGWLSETPGPAQGPS